ncbi:surface-adhesin E family protein [Mangrovimonas sp. ST2L15]|uniref:surface-adhesin E family protein n=1 Tax=Mangrovimonas sp. ST2L15 TaxID=1645916 RepID=UPI0006B43473|nr:surface-adhesin E family protein [Mangrovimonas sp. ST2L15]
MKKFYFLLIVFGTYFNIQAQEWDLINENDEYKLYIRNHSETSAWVKWEYNEVQISEDLLGEKEKLKSMLMLFKFDCEKKMTGILAQVYYDDEGNVISSNDNGDIAIMENVIPESVGEKVLFIFCNSKE